MATYSFSASFIYRGTHYLEGQTYELDDETVKALPESVAVAVPSQSDSVSKSKGKEPG